MSSRVFLSNIVCQLNFLHTSLPTTDATGPSPQFDRQSGLRLSHLTEASAEQARSIFLTLHFLFPHELLPALDILDRKLVRQLIVAKSDQSSANIDEVYYVQSASAVTDPVNRRSATKSSRFRSSTWHATKTLYEVRLDSWNCTCAAFSQSHMRTMLEGLSIDTLSKGMVQEETSFPPSTPFGGTLIQQYLDTPTCKHILAVFLATSAPTLFGIGVQVRNISVEELAGWAAGWGEG